MFRSKGIQFNNGCYWNSALAPLIEKDDPTEYRIFAVDTPFNRRISVVKDHTYLCEAHRIKKLSERENLDSPSCQGVATSAPFLLQTQPADSFSCSADRCNKGSYQSTCCRQYPLWRQAIDKERDTKEAQENNVIPDKLKGQAVAYADNLLSAEKGKAEPGPLTWALEELGRNPEK